MNTKKLDTLPPTENQVIRIRIELRRLGFPEISKQWCSEHREDDLCGSATMQARHRELLNLFSRITGREISSRKEITMGEAGKLISILSGCEDYDSLMEAISPDDYVCYLPNLAEEVTRFITLLFLGKKSTQ